MSRPADPLNPRLVPWNAVLIACGFVAIMMLVQIVNELGFHTGGR